MARTNNSRPGMADFNPPPGNSWGRKERESVAPWITGNGVSQLPVDHVIRLVRREDWVDLVLAGEADQPDDVLLEWRESPVDLIQRATPVAGTLGLGWGVRSFWPKPRQGERSPLLKSYKSNNRMI